MSRLERDPEVERLVCAYRADLEAAGIFAENEVNIEGQALGTKGEVGYVITDIASDYTDEMLGRLARLDATIRIRRL